MRFCVLCVAASAVAMPLREAQSAAEPTPFPPMAAAHSYFTFMPYPTFPNPPRHHGESGKGWFGLVIDSSTGRVQQVNVMKSTGVKAFDDSAIHTLKQWRAKPRVTDHAVVPIAFSVR
jgi:TonB family protein